MGFDPVGPDGKVRKVRKARKARDPMLILLLHCQWFIQEGGWHNFIRHRARCDLQIAPRLLLLSMLEKSVGFKAIFGKVNNTFFNKFKLDPSRCPGFMLL